MSTRTSRSPDSSAERETAPVSPRRSLPITPRSITRIHVCRHESDSAATAGEYRRCRSSKAASSARAAVTAAFRDDAAFDARSPDHVSNAIARTPARIMERAGSILGREELVPEP